MNECTHMEATLDVFSGVVSCACGFRKVIKPSDFKHAAALTLSDEAMSAFLEVVKQNEKNS